MFFIGFSISPLVYISLIGLYVSFLLSMPHLKTVVDSNSTLKSVVYVFKAPTSDTDATILWQSVVSLKQNNTSAKPFYDDIFEDFVFEEKPEKYLLFRSVFCKPETCIPVLFSRPPPFLMC